ncbi:MAG: hypothetical protein IRY97_08760, partial [Thermomicrobiaceae bacterium]|nr:hypothetical protein [Thermomicrobiaceae bacterium]
KRTLLTSLLPSVYRGSHLGHPAVRHVQGRTVEVLSTEHLLFEADGEQPGTTDVAARVVPAALRVRLPAHAPEVRSSR